MNDTFIAGLLSAFGRQHLTPEQHRIIGTFFPELSEVLGLGRVFKNGVALNIYQEAESLVRGDKYIQAIKLVRQYATDNNVAALKGLRETKEWVDTEFGHLKVHAPPC